MVVQSRRRDGRVLLRGRTAVRGGLLLRGSMLLLPCWMVAVVGAGVTDIGGGIDVTGGWRVDKELINKENGYSG